MLYDKESTLCGRFQRSGWLIIILSDSPGSIKIKYETNTTSYLVWHKEICITEIRRVFSIFPDHVTDAMRFCAIFAERQQRNSKGESSIDGMRETGDTILIGRSSAIYSRRGTYQMQSCLLFLLKIIGRRESRQRFFSCESKKNFKIALLTLNKNRIIGTAREASKFQESHHRRRYSCDVCVMCYHNTAKRHQRRPADQNKCKSSAISINNQFIIALKSKSDQPWRHSFSAVTYLSRT